MAKYLQTESIVSTLRALILAVCRNQKFY